MRPRISGGARALAFLGLAAFAARAQVATNQAPVAPAALTAPEPMVGMVPEGLVVEGAPTAPELTQQRIQAYGGGASSAFMGWDPNSRSMLISAQSAQLRQLHVLLGPEGRQALTTSFPEIIAAGGFMPKTGDVIVFTADHKGDEFYQIYRLEVKTGETHLLTDGESRNTEIIRGHSGLQIAYTSTARDQKDADIYVMNPRKLESERMIMEVDSPGWILEDWAHDDRHVLASHLWGPNMGYLWSIDTVTGETRLLTNRRETQLPYLLARYTPHDEGIYVVLYHENGDRTIQYLDLTGGATPKVPADAKLVDDIQLSPDGTVLAYVTQEGDGEKLHLFRTATGEEMPVPALPSGFIRALEWNEAGTELGFSFGSTTMMTQAFSYTIATGELTQWTKLEREPLVQKPITPELVKVRSFDELEISGYLYRPDPRKFPGKRPVLIDIHGGPESEFRPGYLGSYNYYLNDLGVALLFPNVRGSTGFGARFETLDDGYLRENSVKDIGAFLDWIATDPRLDANRVGVRGGSYGGYMTLAALVHYGNRLRCGSDLMGVTDFVTFLHNTKISQKAFLRYEFGDERVPEMRKFLENISPLNHVAEIHDPVMITAGKNDPRVPESESDQMVGALRAAHQIVWSMLGDNEGHGFRRSSDARYQFALEAYFFETYLLPENRLTPLGPEPVAPPTPHVQSTGPD